MPATLPDFNTDVSASCPSLAPDALESRIALLRRKLAGQGLRITPQRLEILRALLEIGTHPTAEAVWERVRLTTPSTSLGTVYKTLDTLQALGEVLELDTLGDKRHYDAVRPDAHPHAVCTRCGRIEDVELHGLGVLQRQAAEASRFHIRESRVTFYGLCRVCDP